MECTYENWHIVASLRVGTSRKTFEDTKGLYQALYHDSFDARDYATSLSEEGYPLLAQWLCGIWTPESIREFWSFIQAAVRQTSFPMLAVVGIAIRKERRVFDFFMLKHPQIYAELRRLVQYGVFWEDLAEYLAVLHAPLESAAFRKGTHPTIVRFAPRKRAS